MKVSEAINQLKIGDTVWVKGKIIDVCRGENEKFPVGIELYDDNDWLHKNDEMYLTEPTKEVKIPEYVAEWIEFCKNRNYSLHTAMNRCRDVPDVIADIYQDFRDWLTCEEFQENEEIFARAWLDGFTVEPKRWVVKFVMIDAVKYFSKFNGCNDLDYNYVGRKENAHIFTDHAKAEAVATLVEGSVEEV